MTLMLFETILDLADAGVATLTLDSTAYMPLPAAHYGYARFHPWDGPVQDRQALFSRAIPAAEAAALLAHQRNRLAKAVASVRGRVDHVAALAEDGLAEWPQHAFPLADGHALLIFCGVHPPALMRLVDVVHNRVMWERTMDELRTDLGVVPASYMPLDPVVYAQNDTHLLLHVGANSPVPLRIGPSGVEAVALPWVRHGFELHFTRTFVVEHERGSKVYRHASLAGGVASAELGARPASRGFNVAVPRRADRVALCLSRGLVQIHDLAAPGSALREVRAVDDELGKDPVHVDFSPDGQYLLQPVDDGRAMVVDLQHGRRARVQVPGFPHSPPHGVFEPTLWLRAASAITDQGGLLLDRGQLHFTPYEQLMWEALPPATPPRARSLPQPAAEALAALRLPALRMETARRGRSHAHGAPHLAAADWPQYSGRSMLLLCELDLAETHAQEASLPLPAQGWLQFFVAAADSGEALLDDDFNPAAWRVQHVPGTPAPAPLPPAHAPAVPWRLAADRADHPAPDHAAVGERFADNESRQAYTRWYDRRWREPPSGGWRLGGYASQLQSTPLEVDAAATGLGPADPAQWCLLLQADSDDVYMWGTDSGLLYFMVPRADLAQADFSRVVALTAGY